MKKVSDTQVICYLITYSETDCYQDILLFPISGEMTKETVINSFCKDLHSYRDIDNRLEKLDDVLSSLKGDLGVDI